MDKIITCEISFIPIQSEDYNKDVLKVLDIISGYNIEKHVGLMSTTLRGDKKTVFRVIEHIFDEMDEYCKFSMDVKLSNECGCDG